MIIIVAFSAAFDAEISISAHRPQTAGAMPPSARDARSNHTNYRKSSLLHVR
jgi:hypothetical protein